MIDDIKEASESLQKLHEDVVRCLERRGVILPRRNIWSYDGSSTDPRVDLIREQLIEVLCDQTELRSHFGDDLPDQVRHTTQALDELLSFSEEVLNLVDAGAKHLAPRIHPLIAAIAAVRVGMIDLQELLGWLVPAPETARIADEQLPTLLACRLKRVQLPLEYIADLIGDPHLDVICDQLNRVLRTIEEQRLPIATRWRGMVELATRRLDELLSISAPVLHLVDHCVGAKFRAGSRFEPRRLKQFQRQAPRIHHLFDLLAELRARLIDLPNLFSFILPAPATVTIPEEQVATLYAYYLTRAGVPTQVAADAIGEFDEISPRTDESVRLTEQEHKVCALRRRIRRFEANLRGHCTTRDRENASL